MGNSTKPDPAHGSLKRNKTRVGIFANRGKRRLLPGLDRRLRLHSRGPEDLDLPGRESQLDCIGQVVPVADESRAIRTLSDQGRVADHPGVDESQFMLTPCSR